jgi:hypothetical protein
MNDLDLYFIKNGFTRSKTPSYSVYELSELVIKYNQYRQYHTIKIYFEKKLIATFSFLSFDVEDRFLDIESFVDKKLRYIKLNNINNESEATNT